MKITVTQQNIDEAVHNNAECCPIALAVKDTTGNDVARVLVDDEFVWIHSVNSPSEVYSLPKAAQNFVVNFDSGRIVRPMEFELK